jgi:carbonic anhydrase
MLRNVLCLCVFNLLLGSCTQQPEIDNASLSPLQQLLEGNKRYVEFHPSHPHQTEKRLMDISSKQEPFAIVISCSDSRVPPELIFDQGLGDLFVVRTAGNVIGEYELASIEYAVQKLSCRVIVVMGHDNCGAIQSFIDQPSDSLAENVNCIHAFLKTQPNAHRIVNHSADPYYHETINNIIYGTDFIKTNSLLISQKFDNQELEIIGAIYHTQNGRVHIIRDDIKQ